MEENAIKMPNKLSFNRRRVWCGYENCFFFFVCVLMEKTGVSFLVSLGLLFTQFPQKNNRVIL